MKFKKIKIDFNFIEFYFMKVSFHFLKAFGEIIACGRAVETVGDEVLPTWLAALGPEDLQFLKRFVLASGSLKDLASEYQVSYPTIRVRLDRLIAKVKAAEDPRIDDPFVRKVQLLVAGGELPHAVAKDLLAVYQQSRKGRNDK